MNKLMLSDADYSMIDHFMPDKDQQVLSEAKKPKIVDTIHIYGENTREAFESLLESLPELGLTVIRGMSQYGPPEDWIISKLDKKSAEKAAKEQEEAETMDDFRDAVKDKDTEEMEEELDTMDKSFIKKHIDEIKTLMKKVMSDEEVKDSLENYGVK